MQSMAPQLSVVMNNYKVCVVRMCVVMYVCVFVCVDVCIYV